MEYKEFPKIARLSREAVITEKIDGTNAQIFIGEAGEFLTGSRTRWIFPEKSQDNYGFSAWAHDNKNTLLELGPGQHFGEWYGAGIQHGYGLKEKRFALFNTHRWTEDRPECCDVVPVLFKGIFSTTEVLTALDGLRAHGSILVSGWRHPEGVVIYHTASKTYFKKTILKDEEWKGNT